MKKTAIFKVWKTLGANACVKFPLCVYGLLIGNIFRDYTSSKTKIAI